MSLFSRIAIGTANWNREYNGSKLSDKDIDKILGYCQCSGIDTLDCATAYGWYGWRDVSSYFKIVLKVQLRDVPILSLSDFGPRVTLMAHNAEELSQINDIQACSSVSGYDIQSVVNAIHSKTVQFIQVPYSLYDRRFEVVLPVLWQHISPGYGGIHVRSIFLRGKILEAGYSPQECIQFCLCNPHIDKVIIGVDSVEQLQQNLDFLHKWDAAQKHDEDLLDPRRWRTK